jgi:excinuclease UvrABC nuclease subunit
MVMDIQKLRTAIFEKTGVRVDASDPIFTLVALNDVMLEECIATFKKVQDKNNAELDERIGKMVELRNSMAKASNNLFERANQAHKAAALKAATEARAEIMEAMHIEVKQAVSRISTAADDLVAASEQAGEQRLGRWMTATVHAVIGGIVAGSTVLLFIHYVK